MKIENVSGQETQIQGAKNSSEKIDEGAQDFKSYLSESGAAPQSATPATSSAGELGVGAVNPVMVLSQIGGQSGTAAVGDSVSAAVGQTGQHLDQLADALQGGQMSLKDLGDVVNNLSEQADNLQQTVKDLPSDHPYRKIGDELKVLAYTESVKWRRGDYV